MGMPDAARVDADFDTTYALASWQWHAAWRTALRIERFRITDRDGIAENNDDHGHGITASLFWQPHADWRLGLEWQHIESRHAASDLLGVDRETGGSVLRGEVRWYF